MPGIVSYFNPFSNQHHALENFHNLNWEKRFLTGAISLAAAFISIPILGTGGIAAFRILTEKFSIKKYDQNPEAALLPVDVSVQKANASFLSTFFSHFTSKFSGAKFLVSDRLELTYEDLPGYAQTALQQLSKLSSGDHEFDAYYDISEHDKKDAIPEGERRTSTLDAVPYLLPTRNQSLPILTKRDDTQIPLEPYDWLVPIVLRNKQHNIHLLLPFKIVGNLKAGETLHLKYGNANLNLNIKDFDPEHETTKYKNQTYSGLVSVAQKQINPGLQEMKVVSGIFSSIQKSNRTDILWNPKAGSFTVQKQEIPEELNHLNVDQAALIIQVQTPTNNPTDETFVSENSFRLRLYFLAEKTFISIMDNRFVVWQKTQNGQFLTSIPLNQEGAPSSEELLKDLTKFRLDKGFLKWSKN